MIWLLAVAVALVVVGAAYGLSAILRAIVDDEGEQ